MDSGNVFHQLSESQKSIWYLEKAHPGTSLNIVAGTLRLKGVISYPALEKALNVFVKKNDSMRIRISESDGVATQYVTEYKEFQVDYFDFTRGGLKDLFSWDENTTRTPFNIYGNQLYYCALFKISDEEGGFYMKMHHLISDAWTMGLTTKNVIDLYSLIKNGETVDASPAPSYIEHLNNELDYSKSTRFEKDKAYWLKKFEILPEMTVLKSKKTGEDAIAAKRKTLITPLKLSSKIREFSSANNLSVFTLFMAALSIYVNRVTGIEDIVLGTTILNRINSKDKVTTGMFVSVAAPVRISISDTMNFKDFAKAMLKENTDVLRHQKYPYNFLIRDLKKKHKFSNRLFDIVLSYQNSKFNKNESEEEYVAKWIFSGNQIESLVISVNDREDGGNLIIDYDFLTDVFDLREIEFIHQHIINLLWHALDNPIKSISKLDMISEKEKHMILHDFNDTYADYPRDKTIHEMFEEQAEKTPNNTALIFNGRKMTYADFNEKSNALAHHLRSRGVGPDKIVGIMVNRSFEMMIGIMGILKAGGAYMPIDPEYPTERKNYMLQNSCAGILLTQHPLLDAVDFNGIVIDLDDEAAYDNETANLSRTNGPKDLAYVIYTSGSTGRPKGVMVEHTAVINRINWMQKKYPLDEYSVLMQKTTYSFDVSVWELFWWSFVGASVCLINSGDEKDPEAMINVIFEHKITTMHFVPSMLTVFLNYIDSKGCYDRLVSLRNIFASGEALSVQQLKLFDKILYQHGGTHLSNLYGPTEATVDVSYFDCTPQLQMKAIPIGKPIDNISLYIFDKNQNLLPVGIPGELYIGGTGVARGYLYNQELTSEKFVVNPFKRNEILYRTGDRVRWYPKGDIEFLGRMDFQVKIKGFRIELGEIEVRLLSYQPIQEAVVKSFSDDGGMTFLTAYIVTSSCISTDEIRRYLSETLPDYMVPASFVFLEKMPLNSNGKADRNALEKPDFMNAVFEEYTPPSNDTETILAEIWAKVLGLKRVGILDEYSLLGGDSLGAIKIITEIHKRFGIEISPKNIFTAQTIKVLSEQITTASKKNTEFNQIPKITKRECYPVSAAQKRQYILNKIDGGISYNLPGGVLIDGEISTTRIENVFRSMAQRQESLRTSFEMQDGEPVQLVHDKVTITVESVTAEESDLDELMTTFVRPFDLSIAPLFRIKLVKVAEDKQLLMFDTHHIISDGASINVILKEFTQLLGGTQLPDLKVQYKDYAAWHNELLKSEKIKKQEAYWLDKFSGEIPVLNMPLDFVRPSFQSFKGNRLRFAIDETMTSKIKQLTAKTGTTLFMLLLSAYNVLLSKYTGQEDIVVGTPVEGRLHADLSDLIGMFVNTLAIRSYPTGEKTFEQFLNEVKEDLLNAYDCQEYPFEELVEKVGVRRDICRNPLFDTTFVLQNMDTSTLEVGGFTAVPYSYNNSTSKFDVSIEAVDKYETIEYSIEYNTDLFEDETIRRLSTHFMNALRDMVDSPSKKLSDISILSESERHQLLYVFNDTEADYPKDKTIHQTFEEQVERTPDKVALIFNNKTMTYAEVNIKATRLAHTLRHNGVGPDSIVGIMCSRSFEMIIGILAILKAEGAYMPIDPNYPAERKKYMVSNSGARILLTQQVVLDFEVLNGIIIDLNNPSSYSVSEENLLVKGNSGNLAYVIYTSGSTGNPKGVMIRHTSVINRINWMQKSYALDDSSVILQKTTFTFDVSVWELFWWFFAGASVCLIQSGEEKDPETMIRAISEHCITTMHFVPSMMSVFLDYVESKNCGQQLKSLKTVFASGEALTQNQVDLFDRLINQANKTKLTNLYGPTEATVDVSWFDCSQMPKRRSVPIGKAIDNIKLYILDKYQKPVPVGIPGELYIGGVGIAVGYLNNTELTEDRFLPNPYAPREKYYKTGDSVRWNEYGEIEFLGRVDFQVKIRGFRIELGEIENRILCFDGLKEAIVLGKNGKSGVMQLYAYYVSDTDVDVNELKKELSQYLPDYMVPSFFNRLEYMPHSMNGKIDRNKLAQLEVTYATNDYIAPETDLQKTIAAIWEEVLGIKDIGLNDNFFDLGGSSLSAIRVFSRLDHNNSITDLYRYPTLREFSEKIGLGPTDENPLLIKLSKKCRHAKTNIICFPYGGGNIYSYKELSESVDNKVEDYALYAVNLPGHDVGSDNQLESIEHVSMELVKQIKSNIDGDIILYSHCVGCAVLVETARILEQDNVKIKSIYIGGIFPPRFIRFYGWIYKPWTNKSDKAIQASLVNIGMPDEIFENEQYTQMMIRAFRHDSQNFSSYFYNHYKPERRINTEINCIIGDKDSTTKNFEKKYKFWNKYAVGVNLIKLTNANHYFVKTHADIIVEHIISI